MLLSGQAAEAETMLRQALAYQLQGGHGFAEDLVFVLATLVDAMVSD